MAESKAPEQEIEKMVKAYQIVQEQLRAVAMQLDQLKAQKADLDRASEELEKATGKVYYTVGGVIVETEKAKAQKEVKDKSELAETRIQSVNKQYDDLRTKEKTLNDKLTSLYKTSQVGM